MAKGSPVTSSRTRLTMMLGEVPMRVVRPPRSAPKESGISSCEGAVPVRRAICSATGRKIATVPMFFMKPERSATVPARTVTCMVVVWRCALIGRSRDWTIPDLPIAVLITSADAMTTRTGSEKPAKAFLASTTPVATAARRAMSATRS